MDAFAPFELEGKVAIVTGAGTGVGRATASLLSSLGADVVVASRRVELLEETAQEVQQHGRRALVVPTDVRNEADCARLIDATMDHFGCIDILINAAGGTNSAGPGGWTGRDWETMIDLNLRSVWLLSNSAAQQMRPTGGGSIVNVSSVAGLNPNPTVAPYGIAKAGVVHLTSILAVEYATSGVRVNCVALGMIKSEGFVKAMKAMNRNPDDQDGKNLVGRPGTVHEAAYPIMFLASPAASYVTGETLFVGGGPRGWTKETAEP
jgi:NAD(P)-dependent dehydrogenase (short-subunit alcohol dehydrogenase family)